MNTLTNEVYFRRILTKTSNSVWIKVSSDILQMALVLKFGGRIEECMKSNFMVGRPNLLKVVLFTFNIIVIESI